MNELSEKVLILDFGSQYTQLIARRVRELDVYSEIHGFDMSEEDIKAFEAKAIILSGGPESVNDAVDFRIPDVVFELNVPVLGICYGMQAMANQLGGEVSEGDHKEFGKAAIRAAEAPLFNEVPAVSSVWMSHGDKVTALPVGFEGIASSDGAPICAIQHTEKHLYGVQFHPEVTHSEFGMQILKNFLHDIAGLQGLWSSEHIIEDIIEDMKVKVGSDKVLLGLSGGVDSSVVAAILHEAIGDQLVCVFVDTGLLRLNEGDQVMETFAQNMGLNIIRVDAETLFLEALKGEDDPEAKRKIIGRLFVEIFEQEANKLKDVTFLAQGTIYPDVIESAGSKTGKAHVIKSHHNVGGLPERMNLKLLEPLRSLFKDEVRAIGLKLGLPEKMIMRHPFPGPGLAVRILGEVKKEFADMLRLADDVFMAELHQHNFYQETAQAFAVFLPVKSVGVMGDGRRYDYVVALRAVQTSDFMTAHYAPLPHEFLERVANRIVNEVSGVSRVVYDITSKPPATIEWE